MLARAKGRAAAAASARAAGGGGGGSSSGRQHPRQGDEGVEPFRFKEADQQVGAFACSTQQQHTVALVLIPAAAAAAAEAAQLPAALVPPRGCAPLLAHSIPSWGPTALLEQRSGRLPSPSASTLALAAPGSGFLLNGIAFATTCL